MSTVVNPAINLAPLTFARVVWGTRCLVIEPPLTLTPSMDEESGRLYVLMDDSLNIHVFAETRVQLAEELAEQLLFQWDTYALESPDRLMDSAQELRLAILGRMREFYN